MDKRLPVGFNNSMNAVMEYLDNVEVYYEKEKEIIAGLRQELAMFRSEVSEAGEELKQLFPVSTTILEYSQKYDLQKLKDEDDGCTYLYMAIASHLKKLAESLILPEHPQVRVAALMKAHAELPAQCHIGVYYASRKEKVAIVKETVDYKGKLHLVPTEIIRYAHEEDEVYDDQGMYCSRL